MNDINWLEKEAIMGMYSQIVENTPKNHCKELDSSKLDRALQEIKKEHQSARCDPDAVDISISYLTKIINDRPFGKASKQMAIACCELFLSLNDYADIITVDNDMLEILVDAAEDHMENKKIANLVREELA